MERRRVILIASIVVTVAVALLLWWLLVRAPGGPGPGATPTPTSTGSEPPLPTYATSTLTTPQPGQVGAVVAARTWAERFTSWSNEDDFSNFDLLASASTPPVRTFLVTYRADLARRYPMSAGYHGQTGRALGPKLEDYSAADGAAHVTVAMQLAESTSSSPTIYNRTLDLKLKSDGGAWLVDFVKWL